MTLIILRFAGVISARGPSKEGGGSSIDGGSGAVSVLGKSLTSSTAAVSSTVASPFLGGTLSKGDCTALPARVSVSGAEAFEASSRTGTDGFVKAVGPRGSERSDVDAVGLHQRPHVPSLSA